MFIAMRCVMPHSSVRSGIWPRTDAAPDGAKSKQQRLVQTTAEDAEVRRGKTGLNRTTQHWDTRRYGTGSGSDRAPAERPLREHPVATAPGTVPILCVPLRPC